MPTISLPMDPDLGQLRKKARELQRAVRSGDPDALALVAELHPDGPASATFQLSAVQLVLARNYGFAAESVTGAERAALPRTSRCCSPRIRHMMEFGGRPRDELTGDEG